MPPSVVRWTFTDVHGTSEPPHVWTVPINPNDGGSPSIEKQLSIQTNTGPNRGALLQEGQSSPPVLSFSGVILSQAHLETFEIWFNKRVLIDIVDDLGRVFRGIFSAFGPQRVRRGTNFWYHTYSAGFTVWASKNASGQPVYGNFGSAFVPAPPPVVVEPVNMLANASFEAPVYPEYPATYPDYATTRYPTSWNPNPLLAPHGVWVLPSPTAPDGVQIVEIKHDTADQNPFIYQMFPATIGAVYTASAWFWIYNDGFMGASQLNRGLVLDVTDGIGGDSTPVQQATYHINTGTPRNQWAKASTSITIPADIEPYIAMRLYGIAGRIRWDRAALLKAT